VPATGRSIVATAAAGGGAPLTSACSFRMASTSTCSRHSSLPQQLDALWQDGVCTKRAAPRRAGGGGGFAKGLLDMCKG